MLVGSSATCISSLNSLQLCSATPTWKTSSVLRSWSGTHFGMSPKGRRSRTNSRGRGTDWPSRSARKRRGKGHREGSGNDNLGQLRSPWWTCAWVCVRRLSTWADGLFSTAVSMAQRKIPVRPVTTGVCSVVWAVTLQLMFSTKDLAWSSLHI